MTRFLATIRRTRFGPRPPAAEAGVALVTVLWFVALMSALAVALVGLGRETALTSRQAVLAADTRIAMAGAVEIAAATLWHERFPASGTLRWRQGRRAISVRAIPEGGKIDLNAASEDLIEGLAATVIEDPRAAQELAHAIFAWRTSNPERRPAGGEADDHARDGGVVRPRDGLFRFVDELRSLRGVDPTLFSRLAPAVSVQHGRTDPEGYPLSPLVQEAVDRGRGLLATREGGESASDPPLQPLDEDETSQDMFVADPSGLYTLDIALVYDDGPTFRQHTVIWIDPGLGSGRHAVLQNRTTVLPELAAELQGEMQWPAR